MNVLGTTTMVKVGQKIPFKPAYVWRCAPTADDSSHANAGILESRRRRLAVLGLSASVLDDKLHFRFVQSSDCCCQANDDDVTPSTWGFAAALACCAVP